MKKYKIINIILIIMIMIMIATMNTLVYGAVDINNIKYNDKSVVGSSEIATMGSYIYSAITSIGIALAVVVLAILGIKYMLGSVEEKAGYKKSMLPYFIGAILVFSASTIASIIYNLAK